MFVCVYPYVCVRMCMLYLYICESMRVYIYICACMCQSVYVRVYAYVCDYVCVNVCVYAFMYLLIPPSPVAWGCRIHRLHLCRRVKTSPPNELAQSAGGCRIHRLHLCRGVKKTHPTLRNELDQSAASLKSGKNPHLTQRIGPVGWSCRIH